MTMEYKTRNGIYPYKTSNGKTRFRYKLPNGKWKAGFKNKTEAKLDKEKTEYSYKKSLDVQEKEQFTKTFQEVAKEYCEDHNKNVSKESALKTERMFEKTIFPLVGNKMITEYTRAECKQIENKVAKLEYSTGHKNRIINFVKNVFKYAEDVYCVDNNPAQIMNSLKKTEEERMKERKVWTEEEFLKFINCVKEKNFQMLFLVMYSTGLRIGETIALRWSDITFEDDRAVISVTKTQRKRVFEGQDVYKAPKTLSSCREVGLGENITHVLREYKKSLETSQDFSEDWYVFGGMSPVSRETTRRRLIKASELAGLDRIVAHGFRHSHATNLVNKGTNLTIVAERLGHKNAEITLRVYAHAQKEASLVAEQESDKFLHGFCIEE